MSRATTPATKISAARATPRTPPPARRRLLLSGRCDRPEPRRRRRFDTKRHGTAQSEPSGDSCADRVPHPDVGLDVAPDVLRAVDLDRDERTLDDVAPALRKGRARPLLPLRHRALDDERARTDTEDLAPEPLVDAEPRIEELPVRPAPGQVVVHRRRRVVRLERRPHRGEERVETVLAGQTAHPLNDQGAETAALVAGIDDGDEGGQGRRLAADFEHPANDAV